MNILEAADLINKKMASRKVDLAELEKLARPSCRKCYGRGYKGVYRTEWKTEQNEFSGSLVPCSCVINKLRRERSKNIEEGNFS